MVDEHTHPIITILGKTRGTTVKYRKFTNSNSKRKEGVASEHKVS
jgi:hypothetical protein